MKSNQKWSEEASRIIQAYWGMEWHIPVYVCGKLTKTLGAYEYQTENGRIIPLHIILSRDLITYGSEAFVRFILKHEICHFVLSQLGMPFRDGDDTFERELKRIGAFSTKKIYVLYRIICNSCHRLQSFDSKKKARSIRERSHCSCGGCFEEHDIHYLKVSLDRIS